MFASIALCSFRAAARDGPLWQQPPKRRNDSDRDTGDAATTILATAGFFVDAPDARHAAGAMKGDPAHPGLARGTRPLGRRGRPGARLSSTRSDLVRERRGIVWRHGSTRLAATVHFTVLAGDAVLHAVRASSRSGTRSTADRCRRERQRAVTASATIRCSSAILAATVLGQVLIVSTASAGRLFQVQPLGPLAEWAGIVAAKCVGGRVRGDRCGACVFV